MEKISITEITERLSRDDVVGAGQWLVIHKHNKIIKPNDRPRFPLNCAALLKAMMLT